MKTKDFCAVIETAIRQLYDQEIAFESLPYVHGDEDPGECLGIVLVKNWHFAKITAQAAHVIATDPDNLFQDHRESYGDTGEGDLPAVMDLLEDFSNLVGTMRVAPYMQWTAIYFPGLTEEQVLGAAEAGHDPQLITDTAVGRDPVSGVLENDWPDVLAWETGVPYGSTGRQRIGAAIKSDGDIAFYDIDRGIYGTIDSTYGFSEATILDAYKRGYYQNDLTSDEPALIKAKQAAEQL